MSKSYFIFNGIDSRDYGITVRSTNRFELPARARTVTYVDGRHGAIIADSGRFDNRPIVYHCEIATLEQNGFWDKYKAWIQAIATAQDNYYILTDSYEPEYIMYGYIDGAITPSDKLDRGWVIGEFDVTFSCNPQKFLLEGTEFIEYPMLIRGTCTSTGLKDSTGIGAHPRVGYFNASGHDAMYFRVVNADADINVKVTQVATNGNTWDSCEQTTVTAPVSGEWVHVNVTNNYIWFEFDASIIYLKSQYLECVWDDTDDTPWRYTSFGIAIVNDTLYESKPEYNVIATGDYKGKWIMHFQAAVGDVIETNMSWILAHTESDNKNFYFDCNNQTVVGENGKTMAKYVAFTEDEAATIFSQSYPVIYPGVNMLYTYAQQSGVFSHDQVSPYTIAIKSNIWTV